MFYLSGGAVNRPQFEPQLKHKTEVADDRNVRHQVCARCLCSEVPDRAVPVPSCVMFTEWSLAFSLQTEVQAFRLKFRPSVCPTKYRRLPRNPRQRPCFSKDKGPSGVGWVEHRDPLLARFPKTEGPSHKTCVLLNSLHQKH